MSELSQRFFKLCEQNRIKPAERLITVGGIGLRLYFADSQLAALSKTSLDFPEGGEEWKIFIYRDTIAESLKKEQEGYGFRILENGLLCSFGGNHVCGVDFGLREGFLVFDESAPLPFEYQCHPLRILLHYIMRKHGKLLVHSAAVGLEETGVMISSCGGRGKSTLALSSLLFGLEYLGDDYIVLSDHRQYAEMLYTSGYLNPDSLEMLPELKNCARASDSSRGNKTLLDLSGYKNRFSCGFKVGAILFPQISDTERPVIQKIPPQVPIAHLAVSTAGQMPDPDKNDFIRAIMTAVRGLPTYQITLVRDPIVNSALLTEFITELKKEK